MVRWLEARMPEQNRLGLNPGSATHRPLLLSFLFYKIVIMTRGHVQNN